MKSFFLNIVRAFQLMSFHGKRITFYEDWAKSMEAGELLTAFLRAELAISSSKQTADDSRAFALRDMLKRIELGHETTASRIVGLAMPRADMMMLAAGDSAKEKDLIQVLRDLCLALREQQAAKGVLLRAVAAPMLLVPGMAAFAYVISSQAIPIIEQIAPPQVWNTFNNSVRVVANFIHHGGAYAALLTAFAGGVLWYLLSRWTGKVRLKMERVRPSRALLLMPVMPWLLPLSIYRDFQAVMILSSLSVLLKSGKTLTEALEAIAANTTPYMRYHVRRILNYLDEYPLEVSAAFASGILSPQVSARLATISRTSKSYENVLIQVGTVGSEEIRKQVQKSASKMNFLLLGAMGALTMFLYIGQASISASMQSELEPATMLKRKLEKEQGMVH
jgi:type II secretory pathway component PulF